MNFAWASRKEQSISFVEAKRVCVRTGRRQSHRFGFTLIELLVVVAIIAVIAAILLPALSAAKARAASARCMSNLKQFGLAFQLYADEHADLIVANKGGNLVPVGATWVEGWLIPGSRDCTNVAFLERSLLGRYLSGSAVWRCPADRSSVQLGGLSYSRVRTMSMNHFMGAPWDEPPSRSYRTVSSVTRPSPSEAWIFIEERPETINDGTFAVQINFDEKAPQSWGLRDLPSTAHNEGCNLVFADSHVERKRWTDPRTLGATHQNTPSPGNADVQWLEQRSTSRE